MSKKKRKKHRESGCVMLFSQSVAGKMTSFPTEVVELVSLKEKTS